MSYSVNTEFFKYCPSCNKIIYFRDKYKLKRSIENNASCFSCSKLGCNNPLFGLTGDTNPTFGRKRTLKERESHSLFMKGYYENNTRVVSNETRKKQRQSRLKWLEKNGKIIKPFYNKEACKYMDTLSDYSFQHALNGGEVYISEVGYWVDGYDKTKNIVFEYDEKHHFDIYGKLKEKDMNRMNEIKNILNCEFLRYNCITKELVWH